MKSIECFELAQEFLKIREFDKAANLYYESFKLIGISSFFELNLQNLKNEFLYSKKQRARKVAVSSWNLSINAAGRACTIADIYSSLDYDVSIIGASLDFDCPLWRPISDSGYEIHSFHCDSTTTLMSSALKLVCNHPFDIVHLSKPRITNIVIGLLYKVVWGADVFLDIDDEELSFVNAERHIDIDQFITLSDYYLNSASLQSKILAQVSVGFYEFFDALTVSNPALRSRYGGEIITHARNSNLFKPSCSRKKTNRLNYGIPLDSKVVLFYGTPRKHKGLVETASALSKLNRTDVIFLIVGSFFDTNLKNRLETIKNVNFIFLEDQPYHLAPDVVSLGDICVLFQNNTDSVGYFQLPAKLIDAISMGLKIYLTVGPAYQDIVNHGFAEVITEQNLTAKISEYLDSEEFAFERQEQIDYFRRNLSVEAMSERLRILLSKNKNNSSISAKGKFSHASLEVSMSAFIKSCVKSVGNSV